MLNDQDINKLKSILVTKDDLKVFATREETEKLISDSEDRMLKTLASKEEVKQLISESEKRVLIKTETLISESQDKILTLVATKTEVKDLKDDIGYLRELVQGLILSNDSIAKSITDLTLEYAAVKMQLSRHDNWIKQIAEKIGLQLVVD
ncbi:MAG: hypothetical protein AAB636_01795 [Patescibacteria group bacterium]|mgnify:CR=1 FL=1